MGGGILQRLKQLGRDGQRKIFGLIDASSKRFFSLIG